MSLGRRTESLTQIAWPADARCAVTLSFDVDAESGYLCRGEQVARHSAPLLTG